MADMKKMKAAWLMPDVLFLHGERGNLLALERAAKYAGIELEVEKIGFEKTDFDPMNYGIILCPPGEMVTCTRIIEWLKPYKEALAKFVESGRVLLVTGTSQCIFGKETVREDGSVFEGLALVDFDFKERRLVYGDDSLFVSNYAGEEMECFGSQIQMMDIESREGNSFGKVIYGFGNCGKDLVEGAVKNNSIFTNILGPMLVLNPWITKAVITKAAAACGIDLAEFDFDMTLEKKSLEAKRNFTLTKKTRLTNHL